MLTKNHKTKQVKHCVSLWLCFHNEDELCTCHVIYKTVKHTYPMIVLVIYDVQTIFQNNDIKLSKYCELYLRSDYLRLLFTELKACAQRVSTVLQ